MSIVPGRSHDFAENRGTAVVVNVIVQVLSVLEDKDTGDMALMNNR
jgi:hypothetical protein